MSKPLTCLILNLLVAMALLLTACSYSPTTPPQTTPENGFKGTVLIGGIFDLSGASAVEGREYAAGILAYNSLFNSKGGANGYQVELKVADFAAKAPLAIEEYQRLLKEGAVAFLAWDTADTLAITRQLQTDRVPLLSASYDEELVRDIKQQSYNFMLVPSYSDQIKLALLYAKRNRTEAAQTEQTRVGFLFSDDQFGRFPQQVGRDYSSSHNITWFHEGVLLPSLDQNNLLFEANRLK
ncbi:MAG: ABC transporter substrate-binding protein, partial [Chloroflexota bacterium]